jgi:ABC-type nitrate/sulfonate/bicarbonate transport system ATPase subunit
MNMVTVSHLNKHFDEQAAIVDLSFSIPRGRRIAIFAPSGSGKTTLIQILARLQQPDSGNFLVDDPHPVVIFQEPRLLPHLTVEENIFLPFQVQKRPITRQVRLDYESWLEVCELKNFRQHFPHQLSGGMKQKAALVRGFLQKPVFAMLDEPFQSIGRNAKKAIIRHLLVTNPGLSILLVTHDPEEVQLLAHSTLYFRTNYLSKYSVVETNKTALTLQGAEKYFIEQRRFYE